MKYPEHEKLHTVKDKSQMVGEFLEWLRNDKNIILALEHQHVDACYDGIDEDQEYPTCGLTLNELISFGVPRMEVLLANFFEIDLKKIEKEKDQMLKDLRAANNRK